MSNNKPRGPVGILGDEDDSFKLGKMLVARTSGVSDADGIDYSTVGLQWLRNGIDIPGATNTSYIVSEEDQRAYLSVRLTYKDKRGNLESVTSKSTRRVPEPRYDTLYVLYKYLLNREPDHEGLVFWADKVLRVLESQNNPLALAKTIEAFQSSENYIREVSRLKK
jgi:hypothetical protein